MENLKVLFNNKITVDNIKSIRDAFPNGGRYCLHKNINEKIQIMIIYMPPLIRYPIHMHKDCGEYYYLISGNLEIEFFSEKNFNKKIKIVNLDKKAVISCYIDSYEYHSTKSGKKGAIYMEIKQGPFDKNNTEIILKS